jgi:hypothetical protein
MPFDALCCPFVGSYDLTHDFGYKIRINSATIKESIKRWQTHSLGKSHLKLNVLLFDLSWHHHKLVRVVWHQILAELHLLIAWSLD